MGIGCVAPKVSPKSCPTGLSAYTSGMLSYVLLTLKTGVILQIITRSGGPRPNFKGSLPPASRFGGIRPRTRGVAARHESSGAERVLVRVVRSLSVNHVDPDKDGILSSFIPSPNVRFGGASNSCTILPIVRILGYSRDFDCTLHSSCFNCLSVHSVIYFLVYAEAVRKT